MARFRFNLETVLTQRARAEQAAQRTVALARQVLVPLQERLADMDRQRRQIDQDMRASLVGPIDVGLIAGHRRYIVAIEKQGMELIRKIAEAQIAVDQAQTILLAAARDKKAIETLKERYFERWQAEQAARENADLDEAGMQIAFNNLTASAGEKA